MVKIIEKDILTVTNGIVTHQVNCMGRMGAGIALKIRQKWPVVYERYRCAYLKKLWVLGKIQLVNISRSLYICNLAGQYRYGRDKQYTEYDAVRTGLKKLKVFSDAQQLQVYIPYKMGCSLAGGDWNIVLNIIEEEIPDAIICKPPGEL